MTVTSGFFNSVNEDRKYTAEQMSSIFDGIITEGVFQNVGSAFSVSISQSNSRTISVGSGRAWVKGFWIYNDSLYSVTIDGAPESPNVKRIDAIVLEINRDVATRSGGIVYVRSITEAANPPKPTMVNTSTKKQIPICYITSNGGTRDITAADIEYVVGTDECPFVAAPLVQLDLSEYLALWQDEFEEWFDDLQDTLEGDVAANLLRRIVALERKIPGAISVGTDEPESIADTLETGDVYIYIPE